MDMTETMLIQIMGLCFTSMQANIKLVAARDKPRYAATSVIHN
jgi:hypothetical protein